MQAEEPTHIALQIPRYPLDDPGSEPGVAICVNVEAVLRPQELCTTCMRKLFTDTRMMCILRDPNVLLAWAELGTPYATLDLLGVHIIGPT